MPVSLADRHAQMLKHARVLQSQIDTITQEATQQIDTITQQSAQEIALIQAELDKTTVRLELLDELLQDDFNKNIEEAEAAYLRQPGDTGQLSKPLFAKISPR
jgi:hypothetical protein